MVPILNLFLTTLKARQRKREREKWTTFGFALIKHPAKVYVCPFSSFMATIKLEEPKKKLEEKMSRVN